MRMRLVVASLLLVMGGLASAGGAGLVNPGFETNDFEGWGTQIPVGGYAVVVGDHWDHSAIEGAAFALLKTDGDGSYTRLWQTFTASAGDKISGFAYFLTTDYLPYDDNAKVWIRSGDENGPIAATLFDESVATVGGWGQTAWTPFEYVFPAVGTWTIEARVSNIGDAEQDSYMGLDGVSFSGTVTVDVALDVRPGSDANPIPLRARGPIPVAVLGTDAFDVSEVDVSTLAFGPGGAAPIHPGGHLADVDGDGRLDLLLHFRTEDAAFQPGDVEAVLTGSTRADGAWGGAPLRGVDTVVVR